MIEVISKGGRQLIGGGLFWAVLALGCAPPEPARVVLEESAAALQRVENGTYRYVYEGTGSLTGSYSGQASFEKPPGGGFFFKVEVEPSPTPAAAGRGDDPSAPPTLTIASNGHQITVRDGAIGRFSYGTYQGGSAHLAAGAGYGLLFQFAEPEPYAAELAGELTYVGQDTIAGVAVDVVSATSPQFGGSSITWYVGSEDRLPRGRDWIANAAGSEGRFTFRMEELATDTTLGAQALASMSNPTDEVIDEDVRVVSVGAAAPEWSLELADGRTASSDALLGQVVVLQVWASWCRSCRESMTEIDRVVSSIADDRVRLIGLNAWESESIEPDEWASAFGVSHEIAARGEAVAGLFKTPAPPAVFVIGADGTLVYAANPVRLSARALAGEVEAAIRAAIE
ncbi:MAG: TlpA family protein disulfide reductase [Gemmatimonadota bacterium]|nr:TlpA family protein disulfide reductase [Gemmatimonadota bacterium]